MLQCYDKGRDLHYQGSPIKVFVQKDVYTVTTGAGRSYGMELALAKLEGAAATVIDRIIKQARRTMPPGLSLEEKSVLNEFVLLQWRRARERFEQIKRREDKQDVVEASIAHAESVFPDKDVRRAIETTGLDRIFRHAWVSSLGYKPPAWLPTKGLVVVHIPQSAGGLLIGSNPVLLAGEDRSKSDGEVILPVATDVAISLALESGQERLIVDERGKLSQMVNGHVFRESDIVAASSRKRFTRLVKALRKRWRKTGRASVQVTKNRP